MFSRIQKNHITHSIVIGLATLLSASAWAGLKAFLHHESSWVLPSVSFLLLMVFLGLNWLLARSKAILLITLIFILIPFFLSFGLRLEYLAVVFLALLFFVLGSFRSVNEKEIRLKINAAVILRRGLPFVLTGLCLMTASAYYFSPLSLIGQETIEIPLPLFNAITAPLVAQFQDQAQGIQESLYQTVNGEINKRSEPYKEFFPIGLSFGIFFALKVISIPFMWLVILIAAFVFRILIWLKAIHIQEKAVLKQVIEL